MGKTVYCNRKDCLYECSGKCVLQNIYINGFGNCSAYVSVRLTKVELSNRKKAMRKAQLKKLK